MIVKLKDSENNVEVVGIYKHNNESVNSFYKRLVEMFPNINHKILQKAVKDGQLLVNLSSTPKDKSIDELLNNLHIT